MPPEVNNLIAAITQLVASLNESAGLPAPSIGENADPRYDSKKERVATAPGLLVRLANVQPNDKAWNNIAAIFAKNFAEINKKPAFVEEKQSPVPLIIEKTAISQEKEQEGFFSKLMKFLLPVLGVVAAIGLAIAAIFAGPGPVGDIIKILAKGVAEWSRRIFVKWSEKLLSIGDEFIEGISRIGSKGLKLIGEAAPGLLKMLGSVAKTVGKGLLKVAKFLPFVGAAVSFYFAYERFKQGDYLGSILEIASGILDLTGVGWIGSTLIDIILLVRDVSTTEKERVEQSGFIKNMFFGIADFFKKYGMTIAKNMPLIGSLIYFWEAYQAGFTTLDGIKKTVTAFASIAGLGPLIEPAINALFSIFTEKDEKEPAQQTTFSKIFTGIKSFFKNRGLSVAKSLPFIGSLIYFWEAYQAGLTTPDGIKKLITSFASILGIGPLIEPAINALFSIFTEKDEESGIRKATVKPFFQIVKEYALSQLKRLPAWLRKPLEWLGFGKLSEEGEMEGEVNAAGRLTEEQKSKLPQYSDFDPKKSVPKKGLPATPEPAPLPDLTSILSQANQPKNRNLNSAQKQSNETSVDKNWGELKDFLKNLPATSTEKQPDTPSTAPAAPAISPPLPNIPPPVTSLHIDTTDPNTNSLVSNSNAQVKLLQVIAEKVGVPTQQIPSAPIAASGSSTPLMGNRGGSISRIKDRATLVSFDIAGQLA